MRIRVLIVILLSFLYNIASAQSFNYSYTDPCNGKVYNLSIPYGQNQIESHNDKVHETGKGKLWEAKVTPYFLNIRNPIDITPNNPSFPTFKEFEAELKNQMGGNKSEPETENDNIKMKYRELDEREKKIVSILKKYTRKNSDNPNKNGKQNKKAKNTKKHVHFNLGAVKKRGTRKKNKRNNLSEKQIKIRNRTLTPMPMFSSL